MRWRAVVEVGIGLVPSTLVYVGAVPYVLGSFVALLGVQVLGSGAPDVLWRLGCFLAAGALGLPPLWALSIARIRGSDPEVARSGWRLLAIGCVLGAILLLDTLLGGRDPLHVTLLAAPLLLAAREFRVVSHRPARAVRVV